MIESFGKIEKLKGKLSLPGDKSISHRAVMFASMAKGKSSIKNCLLSADVLSTINCFRQLGTEIEIKDDLVNISGNGYKGFSKPTGPLDAGNSGTTARLITGILSAQNFETVLIGDESLSKRPMGRILDPLKQMGAEIESSGQFLPLKISPQKNLSPISYKLPVASAQVKSAVLLAGVHLDNTTKVIEPIPTRNHTENMLGLNVERIENKNIISISRNNYPIPTEYDVPSDISSAAFFMVFASMVKNSELLLTNVLMNNTRNGIVEILQKMGADITISNKNNISGEFRADLLVRNNALKNIRIDSSIIPNIIDEIPVLSIAGIFAEGSFTIRNAKELRVKESDRIRAVCNNLKLLGLDVEEFDDGFSVNGEIIKDSVVFESYNDHRIAMAFAVLSMLMKNGGRVNNFECVKISNPAFIDQIKAVV